VSEEREIEIIYDFVVATVWCVQHVIEYVCQKIFLLITPKRELKRKSGISKEKKILNRMEKNLLQAKKNIFMKCK
jgi:hypothetical protein